MDLGFLAEICANCGKTFGSHHNMPPEWCPATEGRMDFMKTTVWKPTGKFAKLEDDP